MVTKNPIIVIPSRLGSTRLPNKPLAKINSVPMIVQVVRRAIESNIPNIVVACAEKEIKDAVESYYSPSVTNIVCVMTNPSLASGSDRIYEALNKYDPNKIYTHVINVQGDLPTIDSDSIHACLNLLKTNIADNNGFDVSTLAAIITKKSDAKNPNIVKALISFNTENTGRALYFSRNIVPSGIGFLYHHIGIYGYTRESLSTFTKLPQSALEVREKLEQLRLLENNISIGIKVVNVVPLGVDTEKDLILANKLLKKLGK